MNTSIEGRTARRPHHIRAALLPLLALGIAATPAWTAPRARAATQRESVTITLAGPNQWNDSGTSFGKAWEDQVAAFQKATPGVIFKTNVLPLTSFFAYEATLLQAGSAPELIFNQTNYKPFQVVPLTKYLMQPNPYAPGNKRWLDLFDPSKEEEAFVERVVGVAVPTRDEMVEIEPSSRLYRDGQILRHLECVSLERGQGVLKPSGARGLRAGRQDWGRHRAPTGIQRIADAAQGDVR